MQAYRLEDCKGRNGEDTEVGKCIYVGSTGSSLIDYVLVIENVFAAFSSFTVSNHNILSDHCIINFAFNICNVGEEMFENRKGEGIKVESKYVWDKTKSGQYRRILESDNTAERLQGVFRNLINNNCTYEQVEESIQSFVKVLDSVFKPLFEKHIPGENEYKPKSTILFNEDCEDKKLIFLDRLNLYRNEPNDENRQVMVSAPSTFKRSIR